MKVRLIAEQNCTGGMWVSETEIDLDFVSEASDKEVGVFLKCHIQALSRDLEMKLTGESK